MNRRIPLHEREALVAVILRQRQWSWHHIAQVLKRDEYDIRKQTLDYRTYMARCDEQAAELREVRA